MTQGNSHRPARSQQTRALSKALRDTYRRCHSWRETARLHGILTPSGQPNPGLAFRIARRKYEPRSPELRARLGLPAIKRCPTCGHLLHPEKVKTWHSLDDLSTKDLTYIFESRSDFL